MQFDSSKIGVEMIKQGKADDYSDNEHDDFDTTYQSHDIGPEPQTKKTMTQAEMRSK